MLRLQPKTLFTQSSLVKNLFLFSLSCSWKRLSSSLPVPYSRWRLWAGKVPTLDLPTPRDVSTLRSNSRPFVTWQGEFSSSGRKPVLSGWEREAVRGLRSPASFPALRFSLFQPLPFPKFPRHISTRGQITKAQGRIGLFWKDDCRLDRVFSRTLSLVFAILLTRPRRANVSLTSPKQKQAEKIRVPESNFSIGRES